jgi:glucoamylase
VSKANNRQLLPNAPALTNLFQELGIPFETQLKKFEKQWQEATDNMLDLSQYSGDKGKCFQTSYNVLMAHEDKTYKGAMIASLSIPWGEIRDDEGGEGGYHLVWTRDMVNSSTGLIAAGNYETAYRSLVFLATSQLDDGSFPQNFWINGEPYWSGLQLDEVSMPIILAHKLWKDKELKNFDPYHLITGAASFLIKKGPSTKQERWEEAAGYSPSTLASMIAALVCAGDFVRDRGEENLAGLFESYADFLEANIENWTVTENGSLHEKVKKHYVRINPIEPGESLPENGVSDDAILSLVNQEPGTQSDFPAKEIVDAGFLELVRYGIREPKSKLIVDSLKVCDSILKVETPNGTCWKRYNHDGYGQREDGSPYDKWGTGRGWILLAGERGHYELASGKNIQTFIKDIENFSNETGLLSEQVWDAEDIPEKHLYKGKPTGAAMPLAWAHSEYIKLLRSSKDGKVFDRIDAVAERYLEKRGNLHKTKFWSFNSPAQTVKRNETLRIIAEADFKLNWSCNDEEEQQTIEASKTSVGIFYVDIEIPKDCSEIGFRFYWIDADEIAEENYSLDVKE